MSKWNKEELENMLEDVVNVLNLSEIAVGKHGEEGTSPAKLVRIILEQKDLQIRALEANVVNARTGVLPIPCVSGSALTKLDSKLLLPLIEKRRLEIEDYTIEFQELGHLIEKIKHNAG